MTSHVDFRVIKVYMALCVCVCVCVCVGGGGVLNSDTGLELRPVMYSFCLFFVISEYVN